VTTSVKVGSTSEVPRRYVSSFAAPSQGRAEALGALVAYVHTWTPHAQMHPGVDFLLTTFESWRRAVGHFPRRKFDLIAVSASSAAERLMAHHTVGRLCVHLELPRHAWERERHLSRPVNRAQSTVASDLERLAKSSSQCWVLTTLDDLSAWAGHVLVLDLLHFVNPTFRHFVKHMQYDVLLKVRLRTLVIFFHFPEKHGFWAGACTLLVSGNKRCATVGLCVAARYTNIPKDRLPILSPLHLSFQVCSMCKTAQRLSVCTHVGIPLVTCCFGPD
jgi:hypothetical protein